MPISELTDFTAPRTEEERDREDAIRRRESNRRRQNAMMAVMLEPVIDLYDLFENLDYKLLPSAKLDTCMISNDRLTIRIQPDRKQVEISEFMEAWYKANSTKPIEIVYDKDTSTVSVMRETARERKYTEDDLLHGHKSRMTVATFPLTDLREITSCVFDELADKVENRKQQKLIKSSKQEVMDYLFEEGPVPFAVTQRKELLARRQERAETRETMMDVAKAIPVLGFALRKLGF